MPLHIILRGIEKVFDGVDNQPKRRRSVKSLMYCREEIEAQYEEWLERQVGKAGANGDGAEPETEVESALFSDENVKTHLENVAGQLEPARAKASGELREVLMRVAARLGELEKTFNDAESLEDALGDLEKLIDAALLESADEKILAALRAETEKQMSQYRGKMEKEVYERTFDLMLLKHLREAAEIPRLSLFYL